MPSATTPTPQTITKPTVDIDYVVLADEELERPYRVIIENDDVTPMDFVLLVLVNIFSLSFEHAQGVMPEAHNTGHALVTVLPLQEAQERVYTAQSAARGAGYPLSFYLEPDA